MAVDDKNAKAERIRILIDAYGIGVRGGVLTPNVDDENAFRKMLGLAKANDDVQSEWKRSNGVRLPITLQKGLSVAEGSTPEPKDNANE